MFTISLSNMMVTLNGVGVAGTPLTWDTQADAETAAVALNALHGLNAYVHPAGRSDLTLSVASNFSFGYDC